MPCRDTRPRVSADTAGAVSLRGDLHCSLPSAKWMPYGLIRVCNELSAATRRRIASRCIPGGLSTKKGTTQRSFLFC